MTSSRLSGSEEPGISRAKNVVFLYEDAQLREDTTLASLHPLSLPPHSASQGMEKDRRQEMHRGWGQMTSGRTRPPS